RIDSLLRILQTPPAATAGGTGGTSRIQHARNILLSMEDEENHLLAQRQAANEESHTHLRNAILTLLILVLGLMGASTTLVLYNFRRRKRTERVLKQSEERFDQAVSQIKDYGIIRLSPTGMIETWNCGVEQISGYSHSDTVGKHFSIFYTEEEKLRGEPASSLQRAEMTGRYECTGLRRRKDGSLFHAHVVFTVHRDHTGQTTGFIKITQDVDTQVGREQESNAALSRERTLSDMKSGFVALASHEFKTPLSVILSSTNLLERYTDPGMADQRARHIKRIKTNVGNLKNLLNDFLSLERLDKGIVRNDPGLTDLPELCEEVVQDMESATTTGHKFELVMLGESRPILVDGHLLRNILNNLLSNAAKYSPERSLVQLDLEFEDTTTRIRVTDQGIGIPADEQQHLFEQFFRARNTVGISGTGLGLSIVKKYLDLMGGSIAVESTPDVGSTFTVTLPSRSVHIALSEPTGAM